MYWCLFQTLKFKHIQSCTSNSKRFVLKNIASLRRLGEYSIILMYIVLVLGTLYEYAFIMNDFCFQFKYRYMELTCHNMWINIHVVHVHVFLVSEFVYRYIVVYVT